MCVIALPRPLFFIIDRVLDMLEAIQVGDMVELPGEGGSAKRRRRRPAGVGHFHEEKIGRASCRERVSSPV